MKEALVSIIVPVYNVEKYLRQCIDSIINQTYRNLEIILVDDGSPDNSPKICDEYAKNDNRIKVIHKENGGVSSARNVGLDNANGIFVIFVDSDDTIDNDSIERLLINIGDNDILISNLNIDGVPMTSSIPSKVLDKADVENFINAIFYEVEGYNKVFAFNAGKIVKLSLIMEFNIKYDLNMKYGEDTVFYLKLISKAKNIYYYNDHFYNYRIVDDSASHRIDKEYFNRRILFYNTVLKNGLASKQSVYKCIIDDSHKNKYLNQ